METIAMAIPYEKRPSTNDDPMTDDPRPGERPSRNPDREEDERHEYGRGPREAPGYEEPDENEGDQWPDRERSE
ncbi:MAG: hypothetical protein ACT4P7_06380 [Gemmatimonadaceae bacterium]